MGVRNGAHLKANRQHSSEVQQRRHSPNESTTVRWCPARHRTCGADSDAALCKQGLGVRVPLAPPRESRSDQVKCWLLASALVSREALIAQCDPNRHHSKQLPEPVRSAVVPRSERRRRSWNDPRASWRTMHGRFGRSPCARYASLTPTNRSCNSRGRGDSPETALPVPQAPMAQRLGRREARATVDVQALRPRQDRHNELPQFRRWRRRGRGLWRFLVVVAFGN